jgi:hypothetical protein
MNAQAPQTQPPIMKGGARAQMIDLVRKYSRPLEIYVGIAIVMAIIFVGRIPEGIAYQANTLIGRALLFAATVFIADTYSWTYGVLMALFTVLIIADAPRTLQEGFQLGSDEPGDTDIKIVTQKKKWWVEDVLKENPLGIEEERVKTSAIQDSSSGSSNSLTSSK